MKVGAVTCVRDEAHLIEEWVAHHLALGIERIHILDNISVDGTREKLDGIAARVPGVTVESWARDVDVQRFAFNRGLEIMTAEDVDWCAFIDADEFIAFGDTASSERLEDMLARHSAHCAIGLHWALYGSAGHVAQPEGLVQEAFLYRAPDAYDVHRHIKSIVRPRYTMGCHHAHGFSLDHPYYTPAGVEIAWRIGFAYTLNNPDLSGWRLNHYFCQWRDRWDAKLERSKLRGKGSVLRTEKHWDEHDRNDVFDPSALRWTPDDAAVLAKISA